MKWTAARIGYGVIGTWAGIDCVCAAVDYRRFVQEEADWSSKVRAAIVPGMNEDDVQRTLGKGGMEGTFQDLAKRRMLSFVGVRYRWPIFADMDLGVEILFDAEGKVAVTNVRRSYSAWI